MKTVYKGILNIVIIFASTSIFAQAVISADSLVKQGVELGHKKKYDDAIAKFNEALKLNPNNQMANYELAYNLFVSGKEKEALPYLEKVVKLNPAAGGAFDMLGSIYDNDKQPEKAIDYYLRGIKGNPEYQRLYFNIAVTYYKTRKYAEAEQYAIDAIKLDPKHSGSQRVYASATYREGKRGCSLLGWCSFLLLEPQPTHSAEAYRYIKNIINYGIKKTDEKKINVSVNPDRASNLVIPLTVITATEGKKNLSPVDSLQLQLTALFKASRAFAADKEPTIIQHYFSDFFEKLGNSDNMPAFTRLVSMSAYRDENLQWFKDNPGKLEALDAWIRVTKREF